MKQKKKYSTLHKISIAIEGIFATIFLYLVNFLQTSAYNDWRIYWKTVLVSHFKVNPYLCRMIKKSSSKPVRVVPPMMEEQEVSTSSLQELLDKEETISNLSFSKGREEGIVKPYKSFKNCTFRHQTFSECKFRSSQLTDVRFENCDLSNISFAESSLYRVEFISCKLLGTNLSETTLNHVLLHDCNAGYINLAMSKMNQVRFSNCLFRNASFNDCRFTSVAFDSCDLVEADFSHAPLRGIDLRTSRISGITLNVSDLKGAIITSMQAMDLLPLLGVIIED